MNQAIYKEVQREYDLKRQRELNKVEKKQKELIETLPKYAELIDKKNKIAIELSKLLIRSNGIEKQIAAENLEIKLSEIEKNIQNLLTSSGFEEDYLKPSFECERCKDTGFVQRGANQERCSCFTQKIVNITYKQNNMLRLQEENFNTFDIAYFSKNADKDKYKSDKSPLINIEEIKRVATNFCQNIDDPKQKNLLFVGRAGTGKTFMSSCIAGELVKNGHTVLYQTAPLLMDMLLDAKFSQDKDSEKKEQYKRVFDVDLLIIDDLGTENLNNTKFTELFNIINTRLLKNKKTIISTNLSLPELAGEYDDRVMSRLIGNYTVCRFFGEDIRLKKKKMNE